MWELGRADDDIVRKILAGFELPICAIEKAVKKGNCSIAEIVQLILGKKLRWLGLDPA